MLPLTAMARIGHVLQVMGLHTWQWFLGRTSSARPMVCCNKSTRGFKVSSMLRLQITLGCFTTTCIRAHKFPDKHGIHGEHHCMIEHASSPGGSSGASK